MEHAVPQDAQSNDPQLFFLHSTPPWTKQNHQAQKYVEADRTHPEPSITETPTRLAVPPPTPVQSSNCPPRDSEEPQPTQKQVRFHTYNVKRTVQTAYR
jgi:hypothetical protein